MKHFIYIVFSAVLIGASMSSCVKEKSFSPIPTIVFEKYVSYGSDSADCYIKFKDGDGDIGGDTISELVLKYWYKLSPVGTFSAYDYIPQNGNPPLDTLFYFFPVSNITPNGQYKALDGEIKIKLRRSSSDPKAAPLYFPDVPKIIKFEITLTDRAGNKSNMVTTDEITVGP